MGKRFSGLKIGLVVACSLALGFTFIGTANAWVPDRPVEFIVPAGAGGGADVMARFISPLVSKYNLSPKPWIVINKSAGAGAEGFMYVKGQKGNANLIIITLDNLFTTPLATGVPFNWRDLTPVSRLALDYFVLWVNAATPYKTPKEYVAAAKAAGGKFKMGGTGSKQEDQIITVALEKQTGAKFTYISYRGGGEVAVQLVGKHVDSTVNNPIEAVSQWRAGNLRPLCVFEAKRMPYKTKITKTMAWSDIPTCKETGLEVEYMMLRGIFMPGGVTADQVQYYVDLLKKVRETPEWKGFLEQGAFNQTTLAGKEYEAWVAREEARHILLMKDAGFLAR